MNSKLTGIGGGGGAEQTYKRKCARRVGGPGVSSPGKF